MSKTDLIEPEEATALEQRLRRMNPRAPIARANFGQTPIEDILDIRGFNLNAVLEIEPDFLTDTAHEHDDDVSSFVFRSKEPFNGEQLEAFLDGILQFYGSNLMRYKGVLSVRGLERRVVLQGVHMMMGTDVGAPWRPGEVRESRIVFIGQKLPKDLIENGLTQALVSPLIQSTQQ